MPATPTGTTRHGHFFESSGHGASVVRSIGEGVLPLRYAYAGSAAYAHDRLAESDGYRSVIGSVELALRALEGDSGAGAAVARMVEIGPAAALQTPDADPATVTAAYRTEDFRSAALEPLRAAGVAADDVRFDVRFDDGAIIGEVVFVRKVRVGSLIVPSGHVLRCLRSRRFAVSDVLSLLERTGFQIRTAIVGDSQEQAVAMAVRA